MMGLAGLRCSLSQDLEKAVSWILTIFPFVNHGRGVGGMGRGVFHPSYSCMSEVDDPKSVLFVHMLYF